MDNRNPEAGRFQTLSTIGKIISRLGWIIMAGGGVIVFILIAALTGGRRGLTVGPTEFVMLVIGFLPSALVGAFIVAAGQTISCFVAIEENTRATWEAQKAVLKALSGHPLPAPDVSIRTESEVRTPPAPIEPAQPAPLATKQVACPKCKVSENVLKLYDVNQYKKFDAIDKSSFGFQSISLTCKNCGCVFRV